ncbi:uncharacterized protein LOC102626205 isoform X1 [Citrus sinensis]|uniref:uncharacterized protein LOC102626205 isoform X1 n=1 Tax=Citrus sinensis TaxID=2711 RepID=UPI002279362D|nr:uncharacterized protein LOC102626205 isoform X1 [Citrus sinensis]XP_052292340.1 uncharacterized protein LOC102626205 isoform X1 [Citrus sinensis]
MAYIPPHKRHSQYPLMPSPPPVMPVPKFNRNLNLGSPRHNADMGAKIVYADITAYRWLAVGSEDDTCFPSSVHLQPFSLEHAHPKRGAKSFVLANNNLAKDNDEVRENIPRSPWESIAEDVWPDVLSACKIVNNEMEEKPRLVARFGHVVFLGRDNSLGLESVREGQVAEETILRQLTKFFYNDVPATYAEKIINEVVPKIGVDFEEYEDVYRIMLSDSKRPNLSISCRCTVKEDKTLELFKVYVDPLRHLVVNISSIDKNLDLRLALRSKKTFAAVSDDEMNSIRNLIDLAILDPEVKGGLRWPMGKSYWGDRYRVIGVQHTETKSYKSPSLRLKIRHADRFRFKTATGETAIEISLELRSIVSEIQDGKIDADSIHNGFKDYLRLIWDHFLAC